MSEKKYIIDDALNYLSTANNFNRRVNGKAVVKNVPPYDALTLEEVGDLLNSFSEQAEYWEDKYKRREFTIENELERTQKLIFSLMDNIVEKEKENEQLRKENLAMKDEQNEMIAHLRKENEKIIENNCTDCELVSLQTRKIDTLTNENEQLRQTTKTQQIRIYCQDKEIQKLQERLNQIPKNIREVWIE